MERETANLQTLDDKLLEIERIWDVIFSSVFSPGLVVHLLRKRGHSHNPVDRNHFRSDILFKNLFVLSYMSYVGLLSKTLRHKLIYKPVAAEELLLETSNPLVAAFHRAGCLLHGVATSGDGVGVARSVVGHLLSTFNSRCTECYGITHPQMRQA